ncbi:MAG: hypothetical protein ACRC1P_11130 [Cellulosilyticaceae bacterium]
MSNHEAGYILSRVIDVLKEYDFFEGKQQEEIHKFVTKLDRIGSGCDYNTGEMLEDHADLGICYCCMESAKVDKESLCEACGGYED